MQAQNEREELDLKKRKNERELEYERNKTQDEVERWQLEVAQKRGGSIVSGSVADVNSSLGSSKKQERVGKWVEEEFKQQSPSPESCNWSSNQKHRSSRQTLRNSLKISSYFYPSSQPTISLKSWWEKNCRTQRQAQVYSCHQSGRADAASAGTVNWPIKIQKPQPKTQLSKPVGWESKQKPRVFKSPEKKSAPRLPII